MNQSSFRLLLAGGLCVFYTSLSAQVENVPVDRNALQAMVDLPTWECQTVSVTPPDVESLLNEDLRRAKNGEPERIAQVLPVAISSLQSGSWYVSNGMNYWLLKVRAERAQNLYVFFNNPHLRDGEALFLLNKDRTRLSGPYNNINIQATLTTIFSDPVEGDEVYVVFKSPTRKNVPITIHGIGYDYDKSILNEGGCVDIMCPAGNCWRIEAQSVGRMEYYNGSQVLQNGTGTLVNSADGGGKPYILTARHNLYDGSNCGVSVLAVSLANLKIIFYAWKTGCQGLSFNTRTLTFQGMDLITEGCCSDVALLQLSNDPRELGSGLVSGLVYAGWDISDSPAQRSVLLHYPSTGSFPANQTNPRALTLSSSDWALSDYTQDAAGFGCSSNYWRVLWTAGGIKVGSSGAPLFNKDNHKIVGTTTGAINGFPACSSPSESKHGKFSISYWGTQGVFTNGGLKEYLGTLPSGQSSLSATMTINGPEVINPGQEATFSLNLVVPLPATGYIFEWSTDMPNVALTWSANSPICTAKTTDLVAGSGHIRVRILMDASVCDGTSNAEILTAEKKICANVYYLSTAQNGPFYSPELTIKHHKGYNLWLTPSANITSIEHIYFEHFPDDPSYGCRTSSGNPISFNFYPVSNTFLVSYYFHYSYNGCVGEGSTNLQVSSNSTYGWELCSISEPGDDRSNAQPPSARTEKSKLVASPNPFSGSTTVSVLNGSPDARYMLQVFDLLGRTVESATTVNPDRSLDLGMTWPSGTYRVLLFRDGVVESETTLIKKGF